MQDFLGDCQRSMSQKVCGDIGAIVTRGYLETLALSRKQNCVTAMLLKGAATAALHAFELLMTTWRTMSEDLFNGALKRQLLLGRSPSKTAGSFLFVWTQATQICEVHSRRAVAAGEHHPTVPSLTFVSGTNGLLERCIRAPRTCCPFLLQHMRRVTDGSCVGQSRNPTSSMGDAASAGLQRPESAAELEKLTAGPASSTGSRCDGPRSAQVGAAWKMQGNNQRVES